MSEEEQKVSEVEVAKRESHHLRGTIEEELNSGTPFFSESNRQILKFHGIYQQDDRDLRAKLRKEGKDKHYQMMIRTRLPGGVMTPEAYLQYDKLSEQYGNQTIRITTRQTFQLHGVLKENLKATIQGIHQVLLTTLGGCGDQVRNTICCADPIDDQFHRDIRSDLLKIVDRFGAKTNAYHEIWLDGEKVSFEEQQNEEPLYQDVYMPRKFKFGFAIEGDNCCDVYNNDVGVVVHREHNAISGYTLLIGGSMGRTTSDKNTYPRLASPLCFVTRDELEGTCEAILKVQRDFGNRENRRFARFKYLIDKMGLDWVKAEVEKRIGRKLTPPKELVWHNQEDHLGWHKHGENHWYLGIFIENGRIHDVPHLKLKTALREIVSKYKPTIRLTTQQNILLCDLHEEDRRPIEAKLKQFGVKLVHEISNTRLNSMACPALPTCGLATAESERILPSIIGNFEALFEEFGLSEENITIRMTGCPNGCARPYIAEIGFTGRSPGKYDLYLGADYFGARLNQLYRELVPVEEFIPVLQPILWAFKTERKSGERFGDFCNRVGFDYLRSLEQAAAL